MKDTVDATVAALIGMIPEGLYLLTSVALAVSMMRLARRKVLTRDMNCIETLAGWTLSVWTRLARSPKAPCRPTIRFH